MLSPYYKSPNRDFTLLAGDCTRLLPLFDFKFDMIFADPPYTLEELETIPTLIFDNQLLNPNGIFVLEHGKNNNFELHPNFWERRVYGSVNFSFFKSL